jgi:hypothetical protein
VDLTGALLGPANLIGCRIVAADFTGATFTGDVWFSRAWFGLDAVFTGVRFAGEASQWCAVRPLRAVRRRDVRQLRPVQRRRFLWDHEVRAHGISFWCGVHRRDVRRPRLVRRCAVRGLDQVRQGTVRPAGVFGGAHFTEDISFNDAEFDEEAYFHQVRFGAYTQFGRAALARADFRRAEFGLNTDFTETRFTGDATFDMTTFTEGVEFIRAKFNSSVNFGGTRFATFAVQGRGVRWFYECHFGQSSEFERTRFAVDVWFKRTEYVKGAGFRRRNSVD